MRTVSLLLLLLTAGPAAAQVRVDVAATTSMPVDIGGRVTLQGPLRLRASTELGFLPGFYVDEINAGVRAFGGYDQATADLVRNTIQSSLVWRGHLGWQPFPRAGFYFEAGMTIATLGGGATASELVGATTGKTVPDIAGKKSFNATSTLDMLDVELGWEFPLAERVRLRTALGGVFTVSPSTTITPNFQSGPLAQLAVSAFTRGGENYLNQTYSKYVHTPVVTVAIGYDLVR